MLFESTKTLKRILYVTPIVGNDITSLETIFVDEGTIMGSSLYSYSFDDVNWSDYNTSDDTITLLDSEDTSSLTTYLRVLVSVDEKPNTTFSPAQYNYVGIQEIKVNGENVGVCGIEYYNDINIIRNDINSNQYNPYRGLDSVHHIKEQISESINSTFGQVSTYFVTVPDEGTKSIIFKSYKVFNTLEPKQIKVMLNIDDEYNGDVQSFQYYADYENLEVEITKKSWESVFGDILPTPKDALYINLFKKMFRIVQVKEDRNFMNRAVAYKFYLGKYIEGVEVNNGEAKTQIDEFSEFLAFDLEKSDKAIAETENAVGIHDEVEHTKEDKDTMYHNDNTTMIYYSKGMMNVETGLKYEGVNYQRYMYHETKDTTYLTKYDITKYNEKNYTASLWIKPLDIGKSIKLFELGVGDTYGEQVYINANGYVTAHINGAEVNQYLTATGTSIVKDKFYGVIFSRMGQSIIVSVVNNVDGVITRVQELLMTNVKQPSKHTQMNVFANKNLMVGNIRLSNESLSNSKLIQTITKYNPNAETHIVIDNCTPTMDGIKVNSVY